MKTTTYIVGLITIAAAPWLNAQINVGPNNSTNGSYSSITAGDWNKLNSVSTDAIIGGGRRNTNNAQYSTISGGFRSYAGADYSTIPGGQGGKTRSQGQLAYASGTFSGVQGQAQFGLYVLRGSIAGTGTVDLSLDGTGTEQISVPTDGSFFFDIDMACRSTSVSNSVYGNCFHAKLLVENINGAMSCQELANVSLLNHNPNLTATYICTNSTFKISGTGETNNTVYWVATIRATELVKP